ncbi:hypothetical protein HYH02_013420 [Chlamydomonas schloesseri]|uniref:Vint domain-containing protein n=1 Tax=Chlamydomonas schloesseri TaxID=2026947 RepID=A0A835SQE9_9CHLO|nr:hypothetical protein HYH02_013420 [Chlamydomonas schloesseri]|eukprot:KAG2431289.1 hypothetical protein HYH02_013420 [Chlamydomonas schloesseri]
MGSSLRGRAELAGFGPAAAGPASASSPASAVAAAATFAAAGGVGLLPILTAAPPDQLARSYSSLQLHQTMHVQGLPTTATALVRGDERRPVAAAAEVAELLHVWRDVWLCHPPWSAVASAFANLSEDKDRRLPGFEEQEFGIRCADTTGSGPGSSGGLWAQLSWPERRMMVELTAISEYGAGIADRDGLYMRLLLRARARRAAMERVRQQHAAAAAAGEDPGRTQQAVQLRQVEELGAAALEADREVAVTRGANTEMREPNADQPQPFACYPAHNAASSEHFPTRFVTPTFLRRFVSAHKLLEVREGGSCAAGNVRSGGRCQPGQHTATQSDCASGADGQEGLAEPPQQQQGPSRQGGDAEYLREYASSLGSLSGPAGATHNLTAAQVWARIVAPALEATGGMSYAEAFLSQVAHFHYHEPQSETQQAFANSFYSHKPLPGRYGVLVPHTPHVGMAELVRSCAAARHVLATDNSTGNQRAFLWIDLFCKGSITALPGDGRGLLEPRRQRVQLSPCQSASGSGGSGSGGVQAAAAAAALAEQVGGRAPGPDVLARCTHVALLAHPAWLSPQQTPAQSVALLPPVLTWPATARRLLEAARYNYAAAAVHTPPPPAGQPPAQPSRDGGGEGRSISGGGGGGGCGVAAGETASSSVAGGRTGTAGASSDVAAGADSSSAAAAFSTRAAGNDTASAAGAGVAHAPTAADQQHQEPPQGAAGPTAAPTAARLTPVVLSQAFSLSLHTDEFKRADYLSRREAAHGRLPPAVEALLQPAAAPAAGPTPDVAAAAAAAAAAVAAMHGSAPLAEHELITAQQQVLHLQPRASAAADQQPQDAAALWHLYQKGLQTLLESSRAYLQQKKEKPHRYDNRWFRMPDRSAESAAEAAASVAAAVEGTEAASAGAAVTLADGSMKPGDRAVLRLERVLRLEGHLPPPPPPPLVPPPPEDSTATGGVAEAGGPAASPPAVLSAAVPLPPPPPVVLLELVVEVHRLVCPADMSQAEADELVGVWVREWACLPDWHTILRTRAACSGGSSGCGGTVSGDSSASAAGRPGRRLRWADMSYAQRRSACELCLLYGPWAANWAPSEEWEAKGRATSSTGAFVTPGFLDAFSAMHRLGELDFSAAQWMPGVTAPLSRAMTDALDVYPGQAAWNPRGFSYGHTTSWVCTNIVLPSTKGYGMCYADLFLSEEAHAACLPAGDSRRFGWQTDGSGGSGGSAASATGTGDSGSGGDAPDPTATAAVEPPATKLSAFASHAWGTPFQQLWLGLQSWKQTDFWIDIFHKNQWQSVAVHDLSDNLRLSGRVALVVFPFPQPLVLTRVWCLFEIMTALQLDVPIKLCCSPASFNGFWKAMRDKGGSYASITPEILAEVEALDVSTAQATVPADKDMILDMIRNSIGIGDMNKQVKELFVKLLKDVEEQINAKMREDIIAQACFSGDGLVPVLVPAVGVVGAAPGAAAPFHDAHMQHRQQQLRRVAEVRPGDWLVTADGGVSRVVLVTVDEVGPAGMEVCALPCSSTGDTTSGTSGTNGGHHLLVTPDHPVFVDGAWRLPRALAPVQLLAAEQVPYGAVFNFELDPPATVAVSGVRLVTLGQDLRLQPYVGVTEESNALYGWGWRAQPERRARLLAQARRLLREEVARTWSLPEHVRDTSLALEGRAGSARSRLGALVLAGG